ncbi:MAG TPA: SUF system NifU family Fe-S cluster assembly protein [Thermoanaerobaculia bacterium]|nr:SUF system NifU family Fe-S cluster assembly protein [Thermoanaerobaculia bacterium]
MSSDLRSLYQEVILDHYKRPRNFGPLAGADRHADGYNPLCGDRVSVHLKLGADGTIEGVSFEGSGCAISTASASLMTEAVAGKSAREALALQDRFHRVLTGQNGEVDLSDLGKLEALSGVRDYPVRIKCATLAWHALKAALEGEAEAARRPVSTE